MIVECRRSAGNVEVGSGTVVGGCGKCSGCSGCCGGCGGDGGGSSEKIDSSLCAGMPGTRCGLVD